MKKRKNNPLDSVNAYAKYSSLAFQMIFIILAGVSGGRWIDQKLELAYPIFTFVLSVASVFLAIYYALKDFIKKKKE